MRIFITYIFITLVIPFSIFADAFSLSNNIWEIGEILIREKRFSTPNNVIKIDNLTENQTLKMGLRIKDGNSLDAGEKIDTDIFVLRGCFTKDEKRPTEYRSGNDDILHEKQKDPWIGFFEGRKFGPGGKIKAGKSEYLWFEFTAPMKVSQDYGQKHIIAEICAKSNDDEILQCEDIKINATIKPIPKEILERMQSQK
jgi:hypothetical protein